ncbi:hypothetical protein DFP89_104200 [Paracoccus lutimaris]|uniref:Uncharacterized protein n=1 Tax=Paracoccus lutimaris TaxID=1490030 RepID=A0A368Z2X4_9RHOB|nr:hypothetical protein DFP89_104200 [Paracoccus lutimaris]
MGCEWDELPTATKLGKATANADWLEEIRPFYLRHSFPLAIFLPTTPGAPIFTGVLDMPHWRPTYIRVNGATDRAVKDAAREIRDAGTFSPPNTWPIILLNRDAEETLDRLINFSGSSIPDEARYLFIYTLERMKFPFKFACEPKYVGPPVPDLSLLNVWQRGSPAVKPKATGTEIQKRKIQPSPVVTAIIDTEIAIAHERFRSGAMTTRIAHFWRQQQESILPATGLATGEMFDEDEINQLLREAAGNERLFYHLLRSGKYGSHGYTAMVKPGAGEAIDPWRLEVATRLKHMIELEAQYGKENGEAAGAAKINKRDEDDRNGRNDESHGNDTDGSASENLETGRQVLVERPLARFLVAPDDMDSQTLFDLEKRRLIVAFVRESAPDKIADRLRLIDYADLREGIPLAPWQRLRRDVNYASRSRSRPVGFRAGHGTHIMDIAAGFPAENAPTDRPIVAVELPDYVIEDTTGARLEAFCLMAMRQILRWVDDWGTTTPGEGSRVPVVVNISLGNAAGPRDGTGFLEQELTRLAAAREASADDSDRVATKIVIAAGNSYRSRLAGKIQLSALQTETVDWCVPPGDKSASYLEIRANNPARMEITFEEPGGGVRKLPAGKGVVLKSGERVVGRLFQHEEAGDAVLTLALAPTLALDAPFAQAPAGTYRLTFHNTGDDTLNIGLGIQRDETLSGYPLYGKQSYLDHPTVKERDPVTGDHDLPESRSPVGRENTISAFSTSTQPQLFVVGGAVASKVDDTTDAPEAPATRYTGSGPTSGNAPRNGPDLAGIAVDAPATPGQRAAGYFSGSSVVFDGTSTATAHVTRRMVDVLISKGGAILDHHDMLKAVLDVARLPHRRQDQRLGHGILKAETAPGRVPRRRGGPGH